ncbi:MAG TPA: hypothetical protein VFT42_02605 [Solirubrobacteraceae bacterium]|nr:hypothetical protein [Solirubrobacteraceae bacterium]
MDEPSFDAALDGLLARSSTGGPPVPEVEALLTRGYAHALELEVERMRLAERVDDLLSDPLAPQLPRDIAHLHAELAQVGNRLHRLRERLAEVASRYGVARPFTAPRG